MIVIIILFAVVAVILKALSLRPLHLKSPEGADEPYHPSVLYFKNRFCDYHYWMAFTPFPKNRPPYSDRWEYPCILVSNDGVSWQESAKGVNPLDDLTDMEVENRDFFSDVSLVYRSDLNRLECWYRKSKNIKGSYETNILRKISTDGIHWSTREALIDLQDQSTIDFEVGKMVRSQAVIFTDNKYNMWYVDKMPFSEEVRNICYSASDDGLNWSKKFICSLDRPINPWHMDIILANNEYVLTVYSLDNSITLWKSLDGCEFKYMREVLGAEKTMKKLFLFCNESLYKSCLVKNDEGYYMYVSGMNSQESNVGLYFSKDLIDFKFVSGKKSIWRYSVLLDGLYVIKERTYDALVGFKLLKRG